MANALKLETITFEEMLELASQGAKVLQTRSVALAMNYNVKLQVLSSFENKSGTFIINERQKSMEKTITTPWYLVRGIMVDGHEIGREML